MNSIRAKSTGKVLDRGFSLIPGEMGCTLSHLTAYQAILDNDLDWACILEGDVILDERFETFISTFQATGLNIKSVYLLGGQNGFPGTHVVKSNKNIKTVGGQKFTKIIKSEHFIQRTCCYLISSRLAGKFIKLSQTDFILADDYGLRKASDVDYFASEDTIISRPMDNFDPHNSELKFYKKQKNELIYDPRNYFYFQDLKYISFYQLFIMKQNRAEEKDNNDCQIMQALVDNNQSQKKLTQIKQHFFTKSLLLKLSSGKLKISFGNL